MDTRTIEEYGTCMVRPPDFDAFWEDVLAQAGAIPLDPTVEHVPLRSTPKVDVYEVRYTSLGGVRVASWYCVPVGCEGPLPAILRVPGYIGEPEVPKARAEAGYAVLSTAPRGKLRSNGQYNPGYPGLLTDNIVDRNTYAYRGFFIDAVRAFDFLMGRDEVDAQRIGVTGSSQGGGLTLVVSALREQVCAAAAGAPYLCGYMDAIELTHAYPYQEIRDYLRLYPDREPEVSETLSYFDGIHFASRVTCPIIVNVGLQDNVCPPETGYAAYRAIASEDKAMYPYEGYGHDAGGSEHAAVVDAFFKTHLNPIMPSG
ncbi:MAG: acetylxylan esterase [Candidatus Latescibacteria bacterium]|jgi:cephalosporin-C deacetylase|nr:acetylxylan esterase [Candidatus Latescibacterota bacterium]